MTDFRKLDPIRRDAGPLELDLVEAYAQGRVSRREFIRRGTVLGLSLGTIGAIISACGKANTGGATSGTASGGSSSPGTTDVGANTVGTTAGKAGGTLRVASIAPAGPLDPTAMVDLGTYGVIAQCFEYLVYTTGDLKLRPGLATSWSANGTGSEWTFKLRQGVKWQDGSAFTADDVVATMERLVKAGNSGLKGIIQSGSTKAADPQTVVFTLTGPNGQFPDLVSTDNPQSAITPKAYATGTTLDKQPNGTGPWKLAKYDAKQGATYAPNPGWWGGKPLLEGTQWTFFQDLQPQVVAMQQGQVDCVIQFSVLGGEGLLNDPNINVVRLRSAAHREVWMRTDKGKFKDKRVRQAVALTFDRKAMIGSLFKGTADVGNDHVIAPVYPYFDGSVAQRQQDIAKAKALLAQAGASNLSATFHVVKLQEIPDLAVLIKNGAAQAGIRLNVSVEDPGTFYNQSWCPPTPKNPPCSGADDIGIVDYGHRGTPNVYLNAALSTGGVWNSSQYASPRFDKAFKDFQGSIGVEAEKRAAKVIEQVMLDDTPIGVPYFYNYLMAHSKKFQGLQVTALGQLFLDKASRV